MIEFDVLRLRDGRLVLAHDYEDAAKRTPLTLDEGLDLFAGEAYADVELDVDLKLPGYEREVRRRAARARARRALADLDPYLETLDRLRELEPASAAAGRSRGAQRDYTRSVLGRARLRLALQRDQARGCPPRARELHPRPGGSDALMAHHTWSAAASSRPCTRAGGELYVWTVDDAAKIAPLEAMGVARRDHQRPAPVRPAGGYRKGT